MQYSILDFSIKFKHIVILYLIFFIKDNKICISLVIIIICFILILLGLLRDFDDTRIIYLFFSQQNFMHAWRYI